MKILKWSCLILVLALINGCVSVEKAERVMRANPDKLAKLCSDCYPVKPSEIIKGDTIVVVDSVLRVDSVRVTVDCPDGTKVDCPPTKIVTKIIKSHSTDTVKVRDTAYETILSNEVGILSGKLDKATEGMDKWRGYTLWLLIIIGCYILVVFVKGRIR